MAPRTVGKALAISTGILIGWVSVGVVAIAGIIAIDREEQEIRNMLHNSNTHER